MRTYSSWARMGQRWPGLLCLCWNTEHLAACSQQGSDSLCQSSEHSPISAGTNVPTRRAVPALALPNEPVTESALASRQGACLQQSKQYSAVKEELRLAGLWLHVHWLRLVGHFCCVPKLFLRPLKISLLCFRAIINHFNPKIESYAAVNHISQLSEDQVSQACDDPFSCWLLEYRCLGVPCAHWDWWCCSNMRGEGGTLVFLVQMRMRGRETRLALANFTITCRLLGQANAERWVRIMKICSIVSKCGWRLWGCWHLEWGRKFLPANLVIGELLGIAWFSTIPGN